MGFQTVLRYMFDVAKAGDEKAGGGECQLTLKGKWTYGYGRVVVQCTMTSFEKKYYKGYYEQLLTRDRTYQDGAVRTTAAPQCLP
ncbi:uncharacterized protein BO88DRAFT_83755 [Aspergillus vadensis CBS 113365]|uniref:Uncharacterized protein n=1 Tax=Aspergillus vadensis (strain CBS 113365 / IMI 142717 / IBT 24658) TaxID=1448311 RepID=A0A319B418_ASPVC|nr:hypothetical protein BO88DRAFT_83755 [Aspergillus vadensis CBS 113365]PYH67105.1 hypothetical protein BO88DRAFT_83755 [Aspergillus vadensis CBS 113365]